MDRQVDLLQQKLRDIFEVKSGYKDPSTQARLLEKHFKYFDSDESGIIDFDEFVSAMYRLNFVGVQAELEALFDRFDEDLNGSISYSEFSKGIFGMGSQSIHSTTSRNVIERVRQLILNRGGKNGIRSLGVILRQFDRNGNRCLEKEELVEGLMNFGIQDLTDSDINKIMTYFDRDNSGKITLDELFRGLRGSMSKRRILITKEAFSRLDTSGDGVVMEDEIYDLYDASQHPEVLSGRMKPQDALREFMAIFEEGPSDGMITWKEFLNYYKDLSAGIENDDEYELVIRNAWHISGGEGWCANTSCRRVLVTHTNGTQEVVEIQNDLGVKSQDTKRMMALLEKQGVQDIARISLRD